MSSKTSVPMEPAPPSLVERLRCGLIPNEPTVLEAADRIETLEAALRGMRKRIQGLEAVLRSIAEFNRYGEASEIASRALENKP